MQSKKICLYGVMPWIMLLSCSGTRGASGSDGVGGQEAIGGTAEASGGTGGQPGSGGKGEGGGGTAGAGQVAGGQSAIAGRTSPIDRGGAGGGTAIGSGGRAQGGGSGIGTSVSVTSGDAGASSLGDGSAGCGISGAPTGKLSNQSIQVGERVRTYAITVPGNDARNRPLPVVFAWHGMGGSGSVARSYFRLDTVIGNQAIIVYPDGLPVNDGSTGWDLNATGIDIAFFDALLAFVGNTYCIDRSRVFSTGHSYGGFFTNVLGCYRGDVLRATAPVAGNPPMGRNPTCTGNVAALIIHGENDPTVDYTRGGVGGKDFWVARNGCATTDPVAMAPSGCLEYQGCQPDLPVVFCTHTEQHDWPTANGRGCSDGGVCFDAATVIWNFFSTRFP